MWVGAGLRDVEDAEQRLVGLVEYCTSEGCYGVGQRSSAPMETVQKLRIIAQLLDHQQVEAKLPILLLLAAHGGMCNVQKEVGIDSAYAQLTRTAAALAEKTSFQSCVFRIMRETREQIMDVLSVKFCERTVGSTNTHYLVPFRNQLADVVGLREIPDPNQCELTMSDEELSECQLQFWQSYSPDVLI